jgi:LmbE family N-acetylglucosaminyl deacetylase
MLHLQFPQHKGRTLTILCLGAHSDDIEIGCGGTILKLIEEYQHIEFYWVVFSSGKRRREEAEESARAFLKAAKQKTIIVKQFRDGFFPYSGRAIKTYFEDLKKMVDPDVIFTHYRSDLHQDHRVISDLTWNTFRNHVILEYEIPKYDGDMGCPNVFVHLKETICRQKIGNILKHFKSQRANQWFDQETFGSFLRLRGVESNAPSKYAEAFYCRKIVF